MSLSSYLAKNYLTADKPSSSTISKSSSKKRKRKHHNDPSTTTTNNTEGLIIADDDDNTNDLPFFSKSNSNLRDGEDDDNNPALISGSSRAFRKTKTSNWKAVGSTAPSNAEQAEADAILEDARREKQARDDEDDAENAPTYTDTTNDVIMKNGTPRKASNNRHDPNEGGINAEGEDEDGEGDTMANGAKAGLQTGSEVASALRKRAREERKRFEKEGGAITGQGQETIYRDASGRIINVAMKRREARLKAEQEALRKEEERKQMGGEVQREEQAKKRQELEDVRVKGVARFADDEDLNRELKERERWNDPMAGIVETGGSGQAKGKGKRKKVYAGGSEPNRYSIRPGYRWDGVDRSNGWEREYFKAKNAARDKRELEYAWQTDI